MAISFDLSRFKSAGIGTVEIDNSQRTTESSEALRMLVGFSNKGPFNRPIFLQSDADRLTVFGDIDNKLEHKGCFFNRMLRTLLSNGPVIALNLLKVDNSYNGPDQVNYAALSLDAAKENPKCVTVSNKYGQYDFLSETIDNTVYGTVKGDIVPYIGTTPFSSLYDRNRFWQADSTKLMQAAARGLNTTDAERGTFEYTNFLNFGNVGTEEFSVLVYKPNNVPGYDVTAEQWYGGKESIPYSWIRPYDYISDYFINVVCVKGNWSNYPVLSTDPIWSAYFDKNGIIKDKVQSFINAEGITQIGSWSGIIIPDFVDKMGENLSIDKRINAKTSTTGLLMAFNVDAANVLTYDYTGIGADSADPDQGAWGIDIDGNSEIDGTSGEGVAPYLIDMCGHGAFMEKAEPDAEFATIDLRTPDITASRCVKGTREKLYKIPADLINIKETAGDVSVFLKEDTDTGETIPCGLYVDQNIINTSVDTSTFIDSTLLGAINLNYYSIMPSGAVSQKKASASSVKFEYEAAANANVPVTASLYYGEVYSEIDFTVSTDGFGNIQHIYSALDKLGTSNATSLRIQEDNSNIETYDGINFLSYNYIASEGDGVIEEIDNIAYFNDLKLWNGEAPVSEDVKNMFIITKKSSWANSMIKVGDYVKNITYNNEIGDTATYQLIPGLARVINKQFIKVQKGVVNYKGKTYNFLGSYDKSNDGNEGFYLITTAAPVLIEKNEAGKNIVTRQLPISDDRISHSLRFIPLKGLQLSSRHRPGYDAEGNLNIEGGIEKIYSVLTDPGIKAGLMNEAMVEYRYIIDSMSYGLAPGLGGKAYLSKVAADRGKCTAILNLPSAKQFSASSNPYFCDTYTPGQEVRPSMNTKYIAEGGNTEMGSVTVFSLPTIDEGATYTACFFPHLVYSDNGKDVLVPPAADVANVLNRKFTGATDPYVICANQNGILQNRYLKGLEFDCDRLDRDSLEPFGVNAIIKDRNDIMIYGNQTAYQTMKTDFNKLHVRENLNTVEIECQTVLKKFNFLYNNAATRASIVSQLTPILQKMQTSGALAQYEIICDESNNTPDIIAEDYAIVNVGLWFNHGLEKIVQIFTVNKQE